MRGAIIYGPRDIRVEDRAEPEIVDPTDAVVRLRANEGGPDQGDDRWDRRRRRPRMRRHARVGAAGTLVDPPGWSRCHGGVPHGVNVRGEHLFATHVGVQSGPAPVRRFLPELVDLVLAGEINPGKVFDLTLPLDRTPEGYRAMDERRAVKVVLEP